MNETTTKLGEALARLPGHDAPTVWNMVGGALASLDHKIVVLDDDPTGVQTVHDVYVYTDWSERSIEAGFLSPQPMFFVLTNSRGFTREHTRDVHEQIARTVARVGKRTGKRFLIISRGDSTLRGHYPGETEALKRGLAEEGMAVDGEVVMPFFLEGGRYTIGDVHYVASGDELVPAGQTEFAKDQTFGYRSSNLREWIEEKTGGAHRAADVDSVPIEQLRALDVEGVKGRLLAARDFSKIVVNAACYEDVAVFVCALAGALAAGKTFLMRSAAALTKVIGGVPDKPLLTPGELADRGNPNGGLIVVGSHVKKTSDQLERLRGMPGIEFIEFNQHLALDEAALIAEQARAKAQAERAIREGRCAAIYTRRERLDLGAGDKEAELRLAVRISDALSGIVADLNVRPGFIIAKGGITSSDVGTKGLGVEKARVMGQILKGVPVWQTGEESKFPDLPYVIFPGNVGDEDALRDAVAKLMEGRNEAV